MTRLLRGETVSRSDLAELDRREMFDLFQDHFENATFESFQKDLDRKNWVILLKDPGDSTIHGFSTLAVYSSVFNQQSIGVVYSGDTIIHPASWGSSELARTWIKTVLRISAQYPQPFYWLLIASGYKTYRFLPVFYKEFYPRYDCPTPPEKQQLVEHLAKEHFGADYLPDVGVVRFSEGATPLKPGTADITTKRLKDPHVRFFLESNPGHLLGDELVCLTRISPENFTPAGKRMAR